MAGLGTRRRLRALGKSALLMALLLPALVLGPVFGGRSAWLHSHGKERGHLHFPPRDAAARGLAAEPEWHATQHHDGGDERHELDRRTPAGVVVHLPEIVVVSSRAAASVPSLGTFQVAAPPTWSLLPVQDTPRHRPELSRSGWPPQSGRRTGVAELLRSSHAILI